MYMHIYRITLAMKYSFEWASLNTCLYSFTHIFLYIHTYIESTMKYTFRRIYFFIYLYDIMHTFLCRSICDFQHFGGKYCKLYQTILFFINMFILFDFCYYTYLHVYIYIISKAVSKK